MSTRAGALGKKRNIVLANSQGRETGRRHVPKTKRLRSDDASGSVPPRRPQAWATADEGDDDDVFATEVEAPEETVSAVRESGRQRSSDHSAARRLLTPPPEAQHVRARETCSEKKAVVDVGGDDDESLERPGDGAVAAAGVGTSGDVAPVSRAREELPVVEREVAHGENKGDQEDDGPLLSRVRRGGMAEDLIDRARLWVDDKAFWTTGEGRRLYNIVHETQEYFVAIANGLQAPAVPRSVGMPKSCMKLTRIANFAQLQQAISRAVAMENIALLVLHG
ncbi:hypothetical protein CBR_g23476 [Chara braunii]|uniref:Uncharacterized protein n=1 Tax=Chara braunii TaxID=69332 RepID=A0A388L4B2_CHABU|nr:hypothetical protein CBR_g23476 [Chara braunii]|eukprot:GBG77149.1 hypothetical protein CBR_g23476 [Chara braunii]